MNVERLRVKKGMLPPTESVKVKVAEPTPMVIERPAKKVAAALKPIQNQLSTPPGWRFPCPVKFEKTFDPETKMWTGTLRGVDGDVYHDFELTAEAYGSFTLETRLTQQFRKWWKATKGETI